MKTAHLFVRHVGRPRRLEVGLSTDNIPFGLRWQVSLSAEVNENINLGYSQDQGYY